MTARLGSLLRGRGFQRADDPSARPHPPSAPPIANAQEHGFRGKGYVPETAPVTELAEFLQGPPFHALLLKGAVLLHDKRAYAEITVEMLREAHRRSARFVKLPTEKTCSDVLAITRAMTPPTVMIARNRDIRADVIGLLEHHAQFDLPKYGLWIQGFVTDFDLSALNLFDAILAFDMSVDERERLRSAAVLSPKDADRLSEPWSVFIYVAARPKSKWMFAQPDPNPCVVPLKKTTRLGTLFPGMDS